MSLPIRGRVGVMAVAVAVAVALGACGGDDSSASVVVTVTTAATTTTVAGNAELCAARDALKASIQDVADVDVIKNGTSALQDALAKVRDNLQAVRSAAGAQLQPQVTALQDALGDLGTALQNASSVGVAGVVTAVRNVASTGSTLVTSLNDLRCG